MRKFSFKTTWWGTLAVIVLCSIFISLGRWQLGRGAEKHDKYELFQQQTQLPMLTIGNDMTPKLPAGVNLLWRKAEIWGHYVTDKQVILDNQVLKGQAGYTVFTPFEIMTSGQIVWVVRGWIPLGMDRNTLPDLTAETTRQRLQGVLAPSPTAPVRFSELPVESLNPQIIRVQTFDISQLAQLTGINTPPYVLRLQNGQDQRFNEEWMLPGSDENKHYAYALQWFTFTIALVIIYLVLGFRRTTR